MIHRIPFFRGTLPAVAIFAAILAVASESAGQSNETYLGGRLEVRVLPQPMRMGGSTSEHGYLVHRIEISNNDPQNAHTVQVRGPSRVYSRDGLYINRIERTVEVGSRSRAVLTIPIPAPSDAGGMPMDVYVDRSRQTRRINLPNDSHARADGGYGSNSTAMLCSRGVPSNVADWLVDPTLGGTSGAGASSGYGASAYSEERSVFRSELPVGEWATQWLAFSRFDGVIVTSREIENDMSAETLDALIRYVECGGEMLVLGEGWTPPAPWDASQSERAATHVEFAVGAGVVNVAPMPNASAPIQRGRFLPVDVINTWQSSAHKWRQMYGRDVDRAMPVTESAELPVRGMIFLIVLFGVVIGPLNILVLHRMHRRIWMLWTTPAIAFVTTGVIFTYAILNEGVTPQRRAMTVTILDQRKDSQHAATFGWTAFYSPLTPRSSLEFGYDTELTLMRSQSAMGQGSQGVSLNWDNGQELTSGWILPRVPAHFLVRKNETRLERLEFNWEADPPTVVNGIGVDVAVLYVADAEGRMYKVENATVGEKVALQPMPEGVAARGLQEHLQSNLTPSPWPDTLEQMLRSPETTLWPNSYLARIDETGPFLEEGLAGATTRECRSVVIGILDETK